MMKSRPIDRSGCFFAASLTQCENWTQFNRYPVIYMGCLGAEERAGGGPAPDHAVQDPGGRLEGRGGEGHQQEHYFIRIVQRYCTTWFLYHIDNQNNLLAYIGKIIFSFLKNSCFFLLVCNSKYAELGFRNFLVL